MHTQIENLQEQLRDKEKQMSSLKERVKSLQADTTNTDTALTTLEEALAEKVSEGSRLLGTHFFHVLTNLLFPLVMSYVMEDKRNPFGQNGEECSVVLLLIYIV